MLTARALINQSGIIGHTSAYCHFTAERRRKAKYDFVVRYLLSEQEHHLCDRGLESDVVAGEYTCCRQNVTGDITVGPDTAVDALCHVDDNESAVYGIGNCVDEPWSGRTVAGAVCA